MKNTLLENAYPYAILVIIVGKILDDSCFSLHQCAILFCFDSSLKKLGLTKSDTYVDVVTVISLARICTP